MNQALEHFDEEEKTIGPTQSTSHPNRPMHSYETSTLELNSEKILPH